MLSVSTLMERVRNNDAEQFNAVSRQHGDNNNILAYVGEVLFLASWRSRTQRYQKGGLITDFLESGIRGNTLRLIEDAHRYNSFYDEYLSNHLPMALVALDRMGATDVRIEAFASRYREKLEPLPPTAGVITDENTAQFLGRREAVASWVIYFETYIARRGVPETLAQWLDLLAPSLGCAAFHGLIRVSYALESGSEHELAHALAHWTSDNTMLGQLPHFSGSMSPVEVLEALNHDSRFAKRRYAGDRIATRMSLAAADPDVIPLIATVDPRKLDVRSQATMLLRAYIATGDFTVLHGVTACLAFRTLLQFFRNADAAQGYLWQALVCAYLSSGGPAAGAPLKGDETLSWPETHRLATASNDEHDIKLAYSCWREWQNSGDDLYRRAASAMLVPTLGP